LNGKTCFRASVVGVDHDSNTFLASTLKRWAGTMPDAGASPTTAGVVFRSCDPGARAETPSNERIIAATRLVAARDQLVASLARIRRSVRGEQSPEEVRMDSCDVVVVGAGIGGSALATALARDGLQVNVLEQTVEYEDRVRGESMMPWGVAEARALGVEDAL